MKLFTKNTFRNLALVVLGAAALSACGGAGSCATCTTPAPGDLTLKIEAPTQYPAGVAVTAYLTMTNTSNTNGTNLVYTVPSATNYTGVTITPDANGAGQNCANIAAGASCTFTAAIPAGSAPGSFTVTATPNGSTSSATKAAQSGKYLQANSISVTANLGLVDIPNTQNDYYILPSDQTITANDKGSTKVMLSVLVKKASDGLSRFKLVDELGVELTTEAVGTSSYAVNSVNTYLVTIPAGKTLQHVQVLSNVCSALNDGNNNNTACSNDADINLASTGHGILSIQPSQFNMSESYESQIITLINIGTGTVSKISYPDWSSLGSQFSVTNNNCTSLTKLTAGQSCTMKLVYTPNSTSGQITPVFSYDDDNNNGTPAKNTALVIPYTGNVLSTPYSVLTASPVSVSLTAQNPRVLITVTNIAGGNTVGAPISSWTLPTLLAPLELESTNCYALSGSLRASANPKTLQVGDSCTYTIKYSSAESAGQDSIAFIYNNGVNSGQTTNVAVDWQMKYNYVYVANSNNVQKCIMESNGQFSNCSATPVSGAPEWSPNMVKTEIVNNQKFIYVLSSSNVYRCSITDNVTGELNSCTDVAQEGGTDINFAMINNQIFAYIVDGQYETQVKMCPVNNDGTFGTCGLAISDGGLEVSGATIATFGGQQYAYLPDYGYGYSVWKCPVNSDGTFSNGELNEGNPGGCVKLKDYSPTLQDYPYQVIFRTVETGTYAYVTGYDPKLQQCEVETNTGNFGTCVDTPAAPYVQPWDDYGSITFDFNNGHDYAYLADGSNTYQCSFNLVNGNFSNCNSFIPIVSGGWSPYNVTFPSSF